MKRPGYTPPPIAFLRPVPHVAAAGSCLAVQEDGSAVFVYGLTPTGDANKAYFYRYAIGRDAQPVADSWQQLATPGWSQNETIDASTSMIVDTSTGRVWLVTADNAAPIYHRFRYYTPTTNAWTALAGGGGTLELALTLVAPLTYATLVHPCREVNSAVVSDDFIYLSCGNATGLARYQISTDTWTMLAVRGGVAAAGSTLDFVASHPDLIWGLRGGGTATCDYYSIAGNVWNVLALVPATETFGDGTEAAPIRSLPGMLLVHRQNTILALAVGNGDVVPLASLEGSDGSQHAGHGVVAYDVGDKRFVAVRLHSSNEFQRIELVL